MRETSARLLRLLSLLQMRREWSGTDLAERLDVDVRTVRRDDDRLRGLGYPVHASPGVAGGYRLGAGASLPPLLLDDDEAVAVVIGLRSAASGGVAGMEESSVRALTKLEQVLPSRLRQRVKALSTVVLPMPGMAPAVDADTLTALAAACRDHERATFDYASRDGTIGRRRVEPHRLVHTGRRWYLLAYDSDREDWRTFRVDRVRSAPEIGARFTPQEPPEDAATYVSRSISAAGYAFQAKVLMYAPAAAVRARISPAAGVVEPIDDHTCQLHTGIPQPHLLPAFLADLGFDFEIIEPPELVEHIRTMSAILSRAIS